MRISRAHLVLIAAALTLAAFFAGCGGQARQPDPAGYCPAPIAVPLCPVPSAAPFDVQVWLPVAGRTVILDPGHGGKDDGTAHFGLREKDINLDLAQRTAALLRSRGVIVHMTRSADAFVPLGERSAFANRNPNAVFVSIHVNASASNPNAAGVETFVLSKEFSDADRGRTAAEKFTVNGDGSESGRQALAGLAVKSRSQGPALARDIQLALVAKLGETNRGVKPGNLAVLRETYFCPAVLVEVGFLSNATTARRMAGEDWRRQTAEALADGIVNFLRRPNERTAENR